MLNLISLIVLSTNLCHDTGLCVNNLNITRYDMPQFVNSTQIEQLKNLYSTSSYFATTEQILSLYPSQKEISVEKVEALSKNLDVYNEHPIIISNGYIIDGHHRVFACKKISCEGLYVLEIHYSGQVVDLITELKTLTQIRHEL